MCRFWVNQQRWTLSKPEWRKGSRLTRLRFYNALFCSVPSALFRLFCSVTSAMFCCVVFYSFLFYCILLCFIQFCFIVFCCIYRKNLPAAVLCLWTCCCSLFINLLLFCLLTCCCCLLIDLLLSLYRPAAVLFIDLLLCG